MIRRSKSRRITSKDSPCSGADCGNASSNSPGLVCASTGPSATVLRYCAIQSTVSWPARRKSSIYSCQEASFLAAPGAFLESVESVSLLIYHPSVVLTFLTSQENLDYYPLCMHANRFSFAFIYRYFFTGSGDASGVLTMQI